MDIQSAVAQRAGVGRYTRALAEHLPDALAAGDSLEVFYFDFQRQGQRLDDPRVRERVVRWIPGRIMQTAWKRLRFPPFDWLAGGADVYHFPNFIRPSLLRGRSVVTLHDVSFLRMPETTEAKNLSYLRARIQNTVRRCDAVITDSRFSAREIEELLPVSADRIHPIHLGLSHGTYSLTPATRNDLLIRVGLDKPFMLFVGTLEPRKNIPFLIEVFEALDAYDGNLVIAGMPGWKFEPILEKIKNSSCADRIHYLKYVDDDLLAALYGGTDLFLFPSLYEGFGFTPLEAMLNGAAVVSSAAGSLPEVLGEAAMILNGYDAAHWAHEIQQLLGDSDRLKALREGGPDHAASYRWEDTARATLDVYRKVAS